MSKSMGGYKLYKKIIIVAMLLSLSGCNVNGISPNQNNHFPVSIEQPAEQIDEYNQNQSSQNTDQIWMSKSYYPLTWTGMAMTNIL